jgi:hypothetical protein
VSPSPPLKHWPWLWITPLTTAPRVVLGLQALLGGQYGGCSLRPLVRNTFKLLDVSKRLPRRRVFRAAEVAHAVYG